MKSHGVVFIRLKFVCALMSHNKATARHVNIDMPQAIAEIPQKSIVHINPALDCRTYIWMGQISTNLKGHDVLLAIDIDPQQTTSNANKYTASMIRP